MATIMLPLQMSWHVLWPEALRVLRLVSLAVGLALQQPVLDELVQPRGRDLLGDLDPTHELVEPRRPVERLAQDQHRRARAIGSGLGRYRQSTQAGHNRSSVGTEGVKV